MSSDLFYRLRVIWAAKDKAKGEAVIPIYGFKSNVRGVNGGWHYGEVTLHTLERIVDEVNKTKEITVCSPEGYCHRALTNRTIEYFELHIKHSGIQLGPLEEKKTIAIVTGKNMNARNLVAVDRGMITMSCEGAPPTLSSVPLVFEDPLRFERV